MPIYVCLHSYADMHMPRMCDEASTKLRHELDQTGANSTPYIRAPTFICRYAYASHEVWVYVYIHMRRVCRVCRVCRECKVCRVCRGQHPLTLTLRRDPRPTPWYSTVECISKQASVPPAKETTWYMYARVCTHIYVCVHVYVCMYVCAYVCACMHVCMYACMYVSMYLCMYVCMYICMYVCMYVCMHACMHVCMHVSMYLRIYLCMHTCMHVSLDTGPSA